MNQKEIQAIFDELVKKNGGKEPSINELNKQLGNFVDRQNNSGKTEFNGLSPAEMQSIIHAPFGRDCVVRYNKLTNEQYNLCPLFRQAKLLIKYIEQEVELKLTAVGNLPPKIVKEMYPLGIGDWMIDAGKSKLSKETDSECVHLARVTLEIAGVIKKRNNKLSLTSTGKKLMKDDSTLFWQMFTSYFDKFNWGYFDGYEHDNLGKFAFPYTFILLSKYGVERKLEEFFADKFFTAFPKLLSDFHYASPYGTKNNYLTSCYCSRTFMRSLNYWGLVNHKHEIYTPNYWVSKTEFFDKLIRISSK